MVESFEKVLGYYRGVYSFTPLTQPILTEKKESVSFPDLVASVLPKIKEVGIPNDLEKVSYGGKDYFVKKDLLTLEKVASLKTGDKVWCKLLTPGHKDRGGMSYKEFCLGTIYREKNGTLYIITDHFDGVAITTTSDWKKYGRYSWIIRNEQNLGEGVKLIVDNPQDESTTVDSVPKESTPKKDIFVYTERKVFGATKSGIILPKQENTDVFRGLGVRLVSGSSIGCEYDAGLFMGTDLFVKPKYGKAVRVIRETKSEKSGNTYCLVSLLDEEYGKYCVINKLNLT